jgi:hypothetical protein
MPTRKLKVIRILIVIVARKTTNPTRKQSIANFVLSHSASNAGTNKEPFHQIDFLRKATSAKFVTESFTLEK